MLSQIRAPAGWERFLQIYADFFFWSSGASCRSRIWAELRSRSCPGASEQRGNPPAAPGEQRKVSTYSHISAGARLCRLKLTSSAEKTRLSEKTLRAVRTGWFQNFPELWKKKTHSQNRSNPGQDLPALFFLLCSLNSHFFFFFRTHWCHWVCSS